MGAARLDSARSAHGMHPLLALALLQPHLLIAHASACLTEIDRELLRVSEIMST